MARLYLAAFQSTDQHQCAETKKKNIQGKKFIYNKILQNIICLPYIIIYFIIVVVQIYLAFPSFTTSLSVPLLSYHPAFHPFLLLSVPSSLPRLRLCVTQLYTNTAGN